MPLNDPFERAAEVPAQAPPTGEGRGLVDPFEMRAEVPSTEPTGQIMEEQGSQQIIPSTSQVDMALGEARRLLAEKSGLSEFSVERATSFENFKPAIIGGSAMTGATVGAPLGPPGILVGGILGAGMGRAGVGAYEREPIESQIEGIAKEMRDEALFAGGAMAIGPAIKLMGPRVGKVFGLDDAGIQKLVKDAERNQVPIALQDVVGEASRKTGKLAPSVAAAYPKVVGVFPFVATPQRVAARKTAEALDAAVSRNLDAMAPNMTINKMGIDVFEAAQRTHAEFRSVANGLYDNFYRMADDLGQPSIIPTKSIAKALDELKGLKGRPTVTVGGVEKVLPAPKIAKDFDNYLESLRGLKENISPAELRAIEQDISKFADAANIKGFDVKQLATVKQALEIAKNSMDVTKAADPAKAAELKDALDTANTWYAAGMSLFSTPAGKKFTKVDKNIFNSKPFKSGEITADQLGPVVVKAANSPQMIRDFRSMVGQGKMGDVAREVIDQAKDKSIKDNILDFYALERNLRLDTAEGVEVMDELMKGTGLNREKLQSLINVGKVHGKVDISDASTFLKRRLLLGGIGTAGLLTEPKKLLTVTVPAVIMLRGGSKFLSSPKVLKWMTTAMDDTVNDKLRRVAAAQLIQAYGEYVDREEGQ